MKERIYTIPVNDAFDADCECSLCYLEEKTINDLVVYFMGPAMMESDVRLVTNEKGFCSEHLAAMYNLQENRLALGLMLHTHMVNLSSDLNKRLEKSSKPSVGGKLLGKGSDIRPGLLKLADRIEGRIDACAICDRLDYTMGRYMDVILWQYFEEEVFRRKFEAVKGFCLPHLALLLRGVTKHLNSRQAEAFVKVLVKIQNASMDELTGDIEWFTQKFDYKNQDKPWGNSRDAIPRTIRKLQGRPDLKQ